jgi:hypothetical protein
MVSGNGMGGHVGANEQPAKPTTATEHNKRFM